MKTRKTASSTLDNLVDPESEKIVLSSLLGGRNGEVPSLDLFAVPAHRTIYAALAEMEATGIPASIITLTQFLREAGKLESVGGALTITELETRYVEAPPVVQYGLDRLRQLHAKRQARDLAKQMENGAIDPADALKKLANIADSSNHLHADTIRPRKIKPPDERISFEHWSAIIHANFPAYTKSAEICASVVVQLLLNDVANPFALALVDVPASGKTITLNFFNVPELVYATDSFTPASFVSHASNVKREDLAKVDLLPRIRWRVMIVRDLAPIFGAKEDDLLKNLGILTRVLDGEGLQTDSGVHGGRGYDGDYLFMLLAGTTPIPPRVFKVMGTLGSRLFFLALHPGSKGHNELIAQNRAVSRAQKERTCRVATDLFLRTLWTDNPKGVEWDKAADPEDCLRVIARCAELLATLRGTIQVWHSDDGSVSHSVPIIEQPDRINCLLCNLARGHALLCGRRQISQPDLAPVLEVTFDSASTIRSKLFRGILESGGALKTSEVEKLLRCSKPTALKEMEALSVLGVCDKQEIREGYGHPENELTLAERFEWFGTAECQRLQWNTRASQGGNF